MNSHNFTPHNQTLRARIEAYQRVVSDYRDFSAHCKKLDSNALGEQADLDSARQVFLNGFKRAQQAVSAKNLQQAQSQGFISADEIRTMLQIQRHAEIEYRRHCHYSQTRKKSNERG